MMRDFAEKTQVATVPPLTGPGYVNLFDRNGGLILG